MSNDFEHKLVKHFEEDNQSFGELKAKTDKLSEQMTINGEHLSYFSKTLIELGNSQDDIKNILKQQNEASTRDREEFKHHREEFTQHRDRMEPMAKNWYENIEYDEVSNRRRKKFMEKASRFTQPVGWAAGTVITLAALIGAIIYIVDKF